ncbi:Pre-mRNA-splicing factor [Trichinella spiralis]|uniref:Pre-mRNA-splicing factor n=1 Tax=Trichinella spiralis TaxID=6334 RepID=A0ABR3KJZ0_TRISP|nr:conserved hypothetical protein [Trichinella spiralis]
MDCALFKSLDAGALIAAEPLKSKFRNCKRTSTVIPLNINCSFVACSGMFSMRRRYQIAKSTIRHQPHRKWEHLAKWRFSTGPRANGCMIWAPDAKLMAQYR